MKSHNDIPLAVRMRPRRLNEFRGQGHVLDKNKLLYRAIKSKRIGSLILYGPAGSGKTSLGLIISKELGAEFEYLNAAFSSVSDLKKIIVKAKSNLDRHGNRSLIFIDEIHRFNKLQQESLVPDTESANIILVGATIYNPYHSFIPSLISRSIVVNFKPLSREDIKNILKSALIDKERGLGAVNVKITEEALEYLVTNSNGDARTALMALEIGVLSTEPGPGKEVLFDLEVARHSLKKNTFYDKKGDYHYDTISAFIKSIRASKVDSALYWLAKMIKAGEDPRFIARRLVILASEDIGNSNPFALVMATSCFNAVDFIGMPEAALVMAQTVIYLSTSPKSNSSYMAIKEALSSIEQEEEQPVPPHLKTHSKNYKYPHNFGGYTEQFYGAKRKYFFPKNVGEEKAIKEFLDNLGKEL